MRATVLTTATAALLLGSALPAAAAESSTGHPCSVLGATPAATLGQRLVTHLSVSCDADEVGALRLTTKVRDVRSDTLKTCVSAFNGAQAEQTCNGPYVKRDDAYRVTYIVTGTGFYGADSYAVCADDGACHVDVTDTSPCASGGGGGEVVFSCSEDQWIAGPLL